MGKQDDQGDDENAKKTNDWFNKQNINSALASLFLARLLL